MSRKHYRAIGGVLAGSWACEPTMQVWKVTLSIADVFAQDNPRFDRARFYEFVFGTRDHFAARDSLAS